MILRTPVPRKRRAESPQPGSSPGGRLVIYEDPPPPALDSSDNPSEQMLCTYQCRQMVKSEFLDTLSSTEKLVSDYQSKLETLNENLRKAEAEGKKFRDQFLYAEQELAAARGREQALQEQLLKEINDSKERLKKQIHISSEVEVKLQKEINLRKTAELSAASAEEKARFLEHRLSHLSDSIEREKKRLKDELLQLQGESKLSVSRIRADERMECRAHNAEKESKMYQEQLEELKKRLKECLCQKNELEKKLTTAASRLRDSTETNNMLVKQLQEELRNYQTKKSPKQNSEPKRKTLQWIDSMDQILVDALLHQVTKGNRVNGQFTTIALDEVVQEVRAKTQVDSIDKDKIINRMKTLKRNFSEAYAAFKGLSGFGWNPITKLFEAEEEVWNELIKTNPNASQWRRKPICQYEKLKELWGKDRATGEHAATAKEKSQRWTSQTKLEQDITIDDIDNMVEDSTAILQHFDLLSSFPSSQANVHREDTSCGQQSGDHSNSTTKKDGSSSMKKRKREDAIATEIDEIKVVMQRVADVLTEGNSIIERSRPRIYSSEEIYAELDCLDVEEDIKFEALELLVNNQGYARVIFGIPTHARTAWLLKKLSAGN